MAKAAKKNVTATAVLDTSNRYDELKAMLDERRRVILQEVQGKIRDVRAEGADRPHDDPGETAEVDIQEDIEFALIQMKAETLNKINEALARLDEGRYGHCFECGDEIAEAGCAPCPSPFAARIAKKSVKSRCSASVQCRGAARRASSTCSARRSGFSEAQALPRRGLRPPKPGLSGSSTTTPEGSPMSDHDKPFEADEPSAEQPFHVPAELPVLPLRDTVLFPNSFMPLAVARESSVRLIDEADQRAAA